MQYVTVKEAFQVIFQDSYLQVKIVTAMREKVCGLCGNFNGNPNDDWTIGNSKYCMSKYPNAVPGELVSADLLLQCLSAIFKNKFW